MILLADSKINVMIYIVFDNSFKLHLLNLRESLAAWYTYFPIDSLAATDFRILIPFSS